MCVKHLPGISALELVGLAYTPRTVEQKVKFNDKDTLNQQLKPHVKINRQREVKHEAGAVRKTEYWENAGRAAIYWTAGAMKYPVALNWKLNLLNWK